MRRSWWLNVVISASGWLLFPMYTMYSFTCTPQKELSPTFHYSSHPASHPAIQEEKERRKTPALIIRTYMKVNLGMPSVSCSTRVDLEGIQIIVQRRDHK